MALSWDDTPVGPKFETPQPTAGDTRGAIAKLSPLSLPDRYNNCTILFPQHVSSRPPLFDRYAGCILFGMIGDALGAPVEGYPFLEILKTHGEVCALRVHRPFPS